MHADGFSFMSRPFMKVELKRAKMTHTELERRFTEHGFEGEIEASVSRN